MKQLIINKFNTAALFFLGVITFAGAGCGVAGTESPTASNNSANPQNAKSFAALKAGEAKTKVAFKESPANVEGDYRHNTHHAGKEGYDNILTIKRADGNKLLLSWNGTYIYTAGKDETFHEASALGDAILEGGVADGSLIEEGSRNGCDVKLTFNAGKVMLKSSKCGLNMSPDGIYKKENKQKKDVAASLADVSVKNETAPENKQAAKKNNYHDHTKPFVRYDGGGTPDALINLMAGKDDRVGCEDETKTFTGKVARIEHFEEFVYEFTLAADGAKRQKFSLVLGTDDRVRTEEVEELVAPGTALAVNFIYCGNGGFATPLEIYKREAENKS